MKKTTVIFILILLGFKTFSQDTYDMRKIKWGMTVKEVKDSETTSLSDEYSNSPGRLELKYKNILIGNYIADISYEFKNGILTQIVYSIYTQSKTSITFRQSILYTKSVMDLLMEEKQMKHSHCWRGDMTSYRVQVCTFDETGISTMENSIKSNQNKFFAFGINNTRTYASFTNDLPDNRWPGLVTLVYFTPMQKVNNSGF